MFKKENEESKKNKRSILWCSIGLAVTVLFVLLAAMAIDNAVNPEFEIMVTIQRGLLNGFFSVVAVIFAWIVCWFFATKEKEIPLMFDLNKIINEAQAQRYIDLLENRKLEIKTGKTKADKEKEMREKDVKKIMDRLKYLEGYIVSKKEK